MARDVVTMTTKAKTHSVVQQASGYYHVTSGKSGLTYHVRLVREDSQFGATCTCDWQKYHGDSNVVCSHVLSVMAGIAARKGKTIRAWSDVADAKRQRRRMVDIGDGVVLTSRKAA